MTDTLNIFIRNIEYDDIQFVKFLNEKYLSENYPIKLWEYWVEKFNKYSFVCICNSSIVGYIISDNTKIISFVVKENYRKYGIGKQLMSKCLTHTTNDIELHCRISNLPALKLYEKFNFTPVETIHNYYSFPKEDAFLLKRLKK